MKQSLIILAFGFMASTAFGQGFSSQKIEVGTASGTMQNGSFKTVFSVGAPTGGELQDVDNNFKTIIGFFPITFNADPTDISLTSQSIDENKPVDGTANLVGTFSTTDPEVNDTHTYTLVAGTGDTDNASFTVTGSQLLAASVFDFEAKSTYLVRVQTDDGDGGRFQKQFTITINNKNDGPTNLALDDQVTDAIDENLPIGTVVGVLTTSDQDIASATDTHTYSLPAGVGDNSSFTITDNQLLTAEAFDFETKAAYSITVRTTDSGGTLTGGGLTFDKVVAITINDTNDGPTDISFPTDTTYVENLAIGTAFGTFATADVDAVDSFTYTLVAGEGDADNGLFLVDGASIKNASILNFERAAGPVFSFRVQTADSGGQLFQKVFTITVTNIDDAPSGLAESIISFDEGRGVGAIVASLTPLDDDNESISNFDFLILSPPPAESKFSLVGNELKAKVSFSHAVQSTYDLVIRISDVKDLNNGNRGSGILYTDVALTININPTGNSSPTNISLSSVTISENQPVGSVIGNLSTTDLNTADAFTYSLVAGAGDADNASFAIDANKLLSKEIFDFETKSSYTVRIETNDGHGGAFQKEFIIDITDVTELPLAVTIGSFDTKQDKNTSQTLTAAVTGGVPPYVVVARYRGLLTEEFAPEELIATTPGNYIFEVLSAMLDEMGIAFEIKTTDAANAVITKFGQIALAFDETSSPVIPFERFGGTLTSWNLFSIPYDLDNKAMTNVFSGLDPDREEFDWRVVKYQNNTNKYVNYFRTGQVKVGEAYWFNSKERTSIKIGAGKTNTEIPFKMTLAKGWNLVGNPYTTAISWDAVIANNPDIAGVNAIKMFNGSGFVAGDVMVPFSGGFVFADETVQVQIDPIASQFGGRMAGSKGVIESNDIDADRWVLPFQLVDEQEVATVGGVGMHTQASLLKDAFDEMTVPRFFLYNELKAEHEAYFYPYFSTDVVPTKGDHTWSFTLSSNKVVGSTNLTWDMEALQNKASSLYLLDQQSGKLVDMKTTDSHTVDLTKGDFRFEVYFAGSGNQVIPNQLLLLGDAYPNPASTQATIPVLLPGDANELVDIDLSVFDINGNRISTLASGKYKPGVYEFTWNAGVEQNRSVSGMFFYRLSFNDNNRAPLYKKLILR